MFVKKNLPVTMWWIVLIAWVVVSPSTFLAVATSLLLAGPVIRHVRRQDPLVVTPPMTLSAYAASCSVTWLGLTKAAIASGLLPHSSGVADRS